MAAMRERCEEVRARLGQPFRWSRAGSGGRSGVCAWSVSRGGFYTQYEVTFEDGVVTDVLASSR